MSEILRETRSLGVRLQSAGVPRRAPAAARVLVVSSFLVATLGSAPPGAGGWMGSGGWGRERSAEDLALEATLVRTPSTDSVRQMAEELAAHPAIAGTESMADSSAWLRARLEGWGLEVTTHEYEVFMPHARGVSVERVTPDRRDLMLDEEVLAADPDSSDPHYPAVAGYSGAGDVTAPVVYANYGGREDFAVLAALGVEVTGKVALVRYGRTFRGMKVRNAVEAGAAAVLLYSDPQDDGFFLGDVYPTGPFRPWSGIQRGSVKIGVPGDPTTPGWASLPGAARIDPSAQLPQVPVVPISYGAASEILRYLGGLEVPTGWQGALPFRYHTGGDRVRVRVAVELDEEPYKRIYDTVGWLRGSERPDEWVIVGAHRDSWTNGAIDNISGTVSVLEAARSLAALRDHGMAPRRSILFALWDAEEWGLIGSAEWVEQHAQELGRSAVAYINQDGIAGGPFFGAVASPSLQRLLLEVTDAVPDPVLSHTSVYRAWLRRSGTTGSEVPPIPAPGAGSDYASFLGRLGIPSTGFGFTGGAGVYHSAYDTVEFMRRFGDPGYRQHRAAAAITASMAWKLANADLLPFDYEAYAGALVQGFEQLSAELLGTSRSGRVAAALLYGAIERFERAAARLGRQVRAVPVSTGSPLTERLVQANDDLRQVERQLLGPSGEDRPWYRNLVFAPDVDDSYRARIFPRVGEALADEDPVSAASGMRLLAARIDAATARLEHAADALGGGGHRVLGR